MKTVDVRDFIIGNVTPYEGDESFLAGPTENTKALNRLVAELSRKERENGGVLDVDVRTVSGITSHRPGYLDKAKEKSSGCRRTNRSNGRFSRSAASE
ncbi:hypothetical protein PACILC2_11520 [Paenibacillus cisolokensis]|uniref:Uncharacterized protein n=1 Tax=Paenibacillus cisolokensis TaxID=1658519 RepID=A0ABQ4N350_9BACL|nr:hypothetical protein PACILC2_11520 [Paenibacillus cisolokensis]